MSDQWPFDLTPPGRPNAMFDEIVERTNLILDADSTLRTRAFDLGALLIAIRDALETSTDANLRLVAERVAEATEIAFCAFEVLARSAEASKRKRVVPLPDRSAP